MELNKYIDNSLIQEYAHKDFEQGYLLDAVDLPKHEQANFLSMLLEHDEILKEKILDRMQELINSRIPEVESEDQFWRKYA